GGIITALAIDSSERAFTATIAGGVFMSTNRGRDWAPRNDGLGSLHVNALQASPTGLLYAVTTNTGLYKYSENDRSSWQRVASDTNFSQIVAIAVNQNATLFIG